MKNFRDNFQKVLEECVEPKPSQFPNYQLLIDLLKLSRETFSITVDATSF